MPVKNTKRRTNDGLEGVITGLTEEEKNHVTETELFDYDKYDYEIENIIAAKVN